MTSADRRFAMELLATGDALRSVACDVAFLDRGNHPAFADSPEAIVIRLHAEQLASALLKIAARLARSDAR
jgi:hypothetical protein